MWFEDRLAAWHAKIDDDRKVIGGNQRLTAAMHHDLHHIHAITKIDVIEMQQWKKARIRPGPSEEGTDGNTLIMIFQQARSNPRNPFIEIP